MDYMLNMLSESPAERVRAPPTHTHKGLLPEHDTKLHLVVKLQF